MQKFLHSPFLVIALLLGGFSTYLAYKGEYESAMAGAGVAVATATAKTNNDESSEESMQAKWYKEQYEELKSQSVHARWEKEKQDEDLRWEKEKLMQIIERAEDIRRYEREMTLEIVKLKEDLRSLRQSYDEQAKIKELELEIERFKTENRLLAKKQELPSLPESKLEAFEPEHLGMQIIENPKVERILDNENE